MSGLGKIAEDTPRNVGRITAVIGVALVAAPESVGRRAGLEPGPAKAFGVADLSLVPGLLLAPRKAPWMLARAAMNVAMAAYYLVAVRPRDPKTAKRTAGALGLLTVADGVVAATLLRDERA